MAYFGHCTHLVVGQAINHDRGATKAIAFIADFNVINAFQLASAFLDRGIDLVLWHVDALGLVDRNPQARVEVDVAAAHLGGHGNFLGNFREGGTALLVLAAFAMLNIGPFTMSGHSV